MQELDLCAYGEPVLPCRIVCLCSNCRSVLADFLSREQDDLNEGQTWLWEAWMSVGAMEQEVSGSAAIRARMRRFWPPVVSFAGGAVAGAVGFSKFGFGALTLPTTLVLYLAIDTRGWANP